MLKKKVISILISCIIIFSSVFLIIIIFNSESESHDYYNALEEWWQPIGASPNIEGENDHSFQSMVIGDLFANGSLVAKFSCDFTLSPWSMWRFLKHES
jgi:hypothetical protein